MLKVTDNVYVESEISVCNTSVVVTKEGVVVIDTPKVPLAKPFADMPREGPGADTFRMNIERIYRVLKK